MYNNPDEFAINHFLVLQITINVLYQIVTFL